MTLRSDRSTSLAALVAGSMLLSGCKAHEMGVNFANREAMHVDNSWLVAVNSCWPDLSHDGYSVADIKRYLADPLHFRASFATYSALDNNALIGVVGKPVLDASAPDASVLNNSPNPVLTRSEAVDRTNLQGTLVANNNGVAPADALCAVQPGTPVGFR